MQPNSLHAARVAALKAAGAFANGASVGLRLGLREGAASQDPLVIYVRKLVGAWAEIIWNASPALGLLQVVWSAAKDSLSPKSPWSQITSPEKALLKCLQSLGWVAVNARRWISDEGVELDLLHLAPSQVVQLAAVAARRASDKAATSATDSRLGGWSGPVAWAPLRRLVGSTSSTLSSWEKAALGSLVGNTV